ncbi:hypothetical protein FRZ03_15265 [Streptomyces misionensis]|uniref:Uncharacterized protein n=1 Tax=Streptomyces misionensis TaxID=67331 RepID=A0A5C6JUS3_9ACTN|nr:hypothetical protein [Streptomyces misionensis]TWV45978.1 hypothetical protein FRZ03_15265 [Streptomyces misionensis]
MAVAADSGLATRPNYPAGSITLLPQYTDNFTESRNITFNGGVPVGGWSSLTLHSNGSYSWTGHMHNSGGVGYNYGEACVIRFETGATYIFDVRGGMGGVFGGSRDFNWQREGRLETLPSVWDEASSYVPSCSAKAGLDIGGTIDAAKGGIPYAMTVLAIIGA